MPFLRYLTIYTFSKLNPDWEIRYYTPMNLSTSKTWNSFENKVEFDNTYDYSSKIKDIPNIKIILFDEERYGIPKDYSEVHKSDIFRYILLSEIGGLWSDMDILFVKSMDECYFNTPENSNVDTIPAIYQYCKSHSIGFMLSSKNNQYFEHVKNKAFKNITNQSGYQCFGVELLNDEFPTIESIKKKFPGLTLSNVDDEMLYIYFPMKRIEEMFKVSDIDRVTGKTIGIHWYGGHPDAGNFTNMINHTNYKKFENMPLGKYVCKMIE